MNNKKHFFDELDNNWEETITDTYKSHSEYKQLLQFDNTNDNNILYYRDDRNINASDFGIRYSIFNNVMLVSFNIIVPSDEGLCIFKDSHTPIYDLKIRLDFYINLKERKNSRNPSSSMLSFTYKEEATDKALLYSYNNLNYNNYSTMVKELLENVNEQILQHNSNTNNPASQARLKRLSKCYRNFF